MGNESESEPRRGRRPTAKRPTTFSNLSAHVPVLFTVMFLIFASSSSFIASASAQRTKIVNSQQVSTSTSIQPKYVFLTARQRQARANQLKDSAAAAAAANSSTTTSATQLRPIRVTYADIERTNKTCLPKDTCASSRHDRNGALMNDPKRRNCFCDQQCIVYEDCCVDSPYRRDPNVKYGQNELFQCVSLRQFGSLYMKTKCPPGWSDETVRKGCEEERSSAYDPISTLPITSTKSGFTFRNYFCALCNNQTGAERMEVWRPRIECPTLSTAAKELRNITQANILSLLEYKPDDGRWGLSLAEPVAVTTRSGGWRGRSRLTSSETTEAAVATTTWHGCGVDPVVPPNVEHLIRFCRPAIKSCPANYTDVDTHRKCLSYTATVYHLQEGYRNVHCAMCNGLQPDQLFCAPHGTSRSAFQFEFNPAAFSLLFDLSPDSGNEVGRVRKCTRDEIYDPFFGKCRSILCQAGQYYKNGHCYRDKTANRPGSSTERTTKGTSTTTKKTTAISTSSYDVTILNGKGEGVPASEETTTKKYAKTPDRTLGRQQHTQKQTEAQQRYEYDLCPKITLDGSEYEILSNGSVYIREYEQTLSKAQYALAGDDALIVCAPAAARGYYIDKFGPGWGYATFVFATVSVICLLLHITVSAFVPELRNLSGKNIVSLSVAFLLVYSTFLATPFVRVPSASCTALAVTLYYSLMAAFCWMLILAWDVSSTLRQAAVQLRVSSGPQWTRFICYSTFGWLLPALLTLVTIVAEFLPEQMAFPYSPRFGQHNCWFGQKPALLIYFVGPVGFILLVNCCLFVDAARVIHSTTRGTSKAKVCGPSQRNFKLYLRLACLMGVSWILGIVAGFVDNVGLWILFMLFNTLQGLFIFIAFTCTSKVYKSLRARVARQNTQASWTWSGIVGMGGGHVGDRGNDRMIRTVSDSSSSGVSGGKRTDSGGGGYETEPPMPHSHDVPHESYHSLHHSLHYQHPHQQQQHAHVQLPRVGGQAVTPSRVSSPIYRGSTTEMYTS